MLDRPTYFTVRPDQNTGRSASRPHIVGLGGTTRLGSSSETALRYALKCAEADGATVELIAGPLLDLPHYDPSNDHRSPSACRLINSLRSADGVIVSTPSYHGGMSGMIKNALDYVEDMRDDSRPYFDGRAVGIIIAAYGTQALGTTLGSVRAMVHALRGWPTPYAATINSTESPFGNGLPSNEEVAKQLQMVARQTVEFAKMRLAFCGSGEEPAKRPAAAV